jgi:antitoxin (DNA-binding transcriptional repressor) of toxin-antitoxin stability system
MVSINAKELHHNTGKALDRLENGETILITRNGRVIGKAEPAAAPRSADWKDIMAPVWAAGRKVPASRRVANPVLEERARRRR